MGGAVEMEGAAARGGLQLHGPTSAWRCHVAGLARPELPPTPHAHNPQPWLADRGRSLEDDSQGQFSLFIALSLSRTMKMNILMDVVSSGKEL